MKVLVATSKTQGQRDDDFCWTVEGELVLRPIECSVGRIDDSCGCRSSMNGMASHRATTTIAIADRPELDAATYFELVRDCYEQQGYVSESNKDRPDVVEGLSSSVANLVEVASFFDIGTVLERRGTDIAIRWCPECPQP